MNWEQVDDTHWRTRVLGGWFVAVTRHGTHEVLTEFFYPDALGLWTIQKPVLQRS